MDLKYCPPDEGKSKDGIRNVNMTRSRDHVSYVWILVKQQWHYEYEVDVEPEIRSLTHNSKVCWYGLLADRQEKRRSSI